jgi:hypothetical protein
VDCALRAVSTIVITIVEQLGCVRLAGSSPGPRPAAAEALKKIGRSSSKEVGVFWMRTVRVLDDFGSLRFAAMHHRYWGYGHQSVVRLG